MSPDPNLDHLFDFFDDPDLWPYIVDYRRWGIGATVYNFGSDTIHLYGRRSLESIVVCRTPRPMIFRAYWAGGCQPFVPGEITADQLFTEFRRVFNA